MYQKLIAIIILSFASSSFAKTYPQSQKYKNFKKKIQKFDTKKRNLASSLGITGQYIKEKVPELEKMRVEIFSAKSPAAIYNLIKKYDDNYNSYQSLEAKYLAASISMLRPLKSIYWRADPLLASYLGDKKVSTMNTAQNSYTSLIYGIANLQNVFSSSHPESQWENGFKYLALPDDKFTFEPLSTTAVCKKSGYNKKWGNAFNKEVDFKAFLACGYTPALDKAITRFGKIADTLEGKSLDSTILWDNKIFFDKNSFAPGSGSDSNRIRKITTADVYALMASLYSAKSSIEAVLAYKLEGLINITNKIGYELASPGVRTSSFSDNSLTSRERRNIVKSQRLFLNAETSTFYGHDYKSRLSRSLTALEKWWEYSDLSRDLYDKLGNSFEDSNTQLFINPGMMNFANQQNITLSFDHLKDMIFSDQATVTSAITNNQIQIKFRSLFGDNAPTNLQDYMPKDFNAIKRSGTYFSKKLNKKITYRNYDHEAATSWEYKKYQKVFPGINNKKQLRDAAVIMSQTWGSSLGLPILNQVFL